MGDAECPPGVERAHQIEYLINEKAGTRDLDDSEIVDADEGGSDDEGDVIVISSDEDNGLKKPPHKKAITIKAEPTALPLGPIARHSVSNPLSSPLVATRNARTSWNTPTDLLQSISRSLDPSLSAARDEERAMRSLQTTQFMSLSNQLRDAQGTANDLRSQLLQADRARNDVERRADHAELELQMERMQAAPSMSMQSPEYSGPIRRDRHAYCGRERRICRRITRYRGGGESTTFVTPSDGEEEASCQPWLDDEILSCEYVDTTPHHQYTLTGHHRTSDTTPLSPYHEHLPDHAEARLTNPAGATSSHTAVIGIDLTPSRVWGHNVSISVTPHREASQLGDEPYSGWEDTPRSSGPHHD